MPKRVYAYTLGAVFLLLLIILVNIYVRQKLPAIFRESQKSVANPTEKTEKELLSSSNQEVSLKFPKENSVVTSPLKVEGLVSPGWMFEGQLIMRLIDNNNNLIAQGLGKEVVRGSWMEEKPINFWGEITYKTNEENGYLIIENDNPSGLPENSKSYRIKVNFK